MMKIRIIFLIGLVLLSMSSCTKNEGTFSIDIIADKDEMIAGESVQFYISGEADFITYFSGVDSVSTYSNYPLAKGVVVSKRLIEQKYTRHGINEAVFIANSYADWSEKQFKKVFTFPINVIDNRTGVLSFDMQQSGLGKPKYIGEINNEDSSIICTVPDGYDVSSMQSTIITISSSAKVYLDGEIFVNKSLVDYSSGSKVFTVRAPDGSEEMWTVGVIH